MRTGDGCVLEVVVEHDVEAQPERQDEEDVPQQEEEKCRQYLQKQIVTFLLLYYYYIIIIILYFLLFLLFDFIITIYSVEFMKTSLSTLDKKIQIIVFFFYYSINSTL